MRIGGGEFVDFQDSGVVDKSVFRVRFLPEVSIVFPVCINHALSIIFNNVLCIQPEQPVSIQPEQPVSIQPVPMTSTLSTYRDGKKVQCPWCERFFDTQTHTQASSDTDDTTSDVTVVTESAVALVGTFVFVI